MKNYLAASWGALDAAGDVVGEPLQVYVIADRDTDQILLEVPL